jgi:nucleoside-diphosphate-sugar epimerase
MKVLLTGANGFVGSHVLDCLLEQEIPVAVLLRPGSDRSFITTSIARTEVRSGSITDPASLARAMEGITQVIHCAGATKARRLAEFYQTNEQGTRNVVEAIREAGRNVLRLVHVSSLAAAGPAVPEQPAREDDAPHPVSEYGRSKLAGERQVREHCPVEHVIVRPPAVYGPRDRGFLSMFEAVNRHLLPRPSRRQALSLVYVRDLAEGIVAAMRHPAAGGRIYYASGSEVVTGCDLADEIARQIGHWTVPVPLPALALWPVCFTQQVITAIMGKANILSLQKYAELKAPGWVCDGSRLPRELGYRCATPLREGIARTLAWYRREGWL